jgi:nucleotide-binding universal stress UspA family protein
MSAAGESASGAAPVYTRILVPVDLEHGRHVEDALHLSAEIAESHGADVHLLSVINAAPVVVSQHLPQGYEQIAAKSAEKELAPLVAQMGPAAKRVTTCVRFGGVYQEILAYAKKIGADLIVIGSHKPNVGDYLLGSNASRVVRHADCSVFVVR